MSDEIKTYGPYGDVRKQAEQAPARADSGLSSEQIAESRQRFETFEARLVSRHGSLSADRENILKGELPAGAHLMPNRVSSNIRKTAQAFGGIPAGVGFGNVSNQGGQFQTGQYIQTPRPYQPEFDSPDRLSYPVHRILANRYWRLFHKLDGLIGTGIDIYSEMPFSKFQLGGEGIEGEIKRGFESQIEETELLSVLPHFVREYLVTGEAVPHTIFDEAKGYWVHISLHNPDQLEVIDAPFLHMDPIVEFVPDDRLRQIVSSSDPALLEVRKSIPPELVARIQSGQNIPLDALNVTFLPRKLHLYDSRGTSIISRLWRVNMYEDGVYSASIATARRHASPIKVVKMGNERTGWIPGPTAESKMADLLAKAELDPHAWLVTHYGVAFEAWGTTDRTMSISRELDAIERIKLVGLGIPKALVIGEVTYASAEKGLTVMLHRAKSMRNMIESKWMIPKYFRAVSKMNGWRKLTKSESRRNYRIKLKASEIQDSDWIVPTIEWETQLSSRVDADMQRAIEGLERLNIKISKTTKMSTVAGLNYEKEQRKIKEETELDRELAKESPDIANAPEANAVGDVVPPMPPGADTAEAQNPNHVHKVPVPTPPGSKDPADHDQGASLYTPAPMPPVDEKEAAAEVEAPLPPKKSYWDKDAHVRPIAEFLAGNPDPMIDSDLWREWHKKDSTNLQATKRTAEEVWASLDDHLVAKGYLDEEINNLYSILVSEKILHDPAMETFEALPEDAAHLSDEEFNKLSDPTLPAELKKKSEESVEKIQEKPDTFLTGVIDPPKSTQTVVPTNKNLKDKWSKLLTHLSHHRTAPRLTNSSGRFDVNIDASPWDSPINQEARSKWQKRLDTSKLPDIVKSRVKYLENACIQKWDSGWEGVWSALDKRLNTKMRLEPESVRELLSSEITRHIDRLHDQGFHDAFADIYAEGKLTSYKPLKFDDIKRERLYKNKTASFSKIAITVDSVSERQVLDQIADSALAKVTNTVSGDVKDRILDALTAPGSYSESVMDLANKIIQEKSTDLQNDPNLSKDQLKDRLKELYDTQAYNIQRIMRTEAINAYAIATLRGYQEQGIVKVKWNAHNDLENTCNICRSLDGVEFEIAYLLTLGNYPISSLSHPQCRCWLSPIIVHVSFEEFEKEYAKTHPTEFAPTQTVVDSGQIPELAQIIKDLKTKISEIKGLPVEYEEPVSTALTSIESAKPQYADMMPKDIRIVSDIAATPEFQNEVGESTAKDLANQVTHYKNSDDVVFVSGFAVRDENPSSMIMKTWAQGIWDKDQATKSRFKDLYEKATERSVPEDISMQSANKLSEILEPIAVARKVQVGPILALTLNKKFKDLDDARALEVLDAGGIRKTDAEKIVRWKKEYILWDLSSGGVIQSESQPESSPFVNEAASIDPEHYFIESLDAYYTMPAELQAKDPDVYQTIHDLYFNRQEFFDLQPGSK